MTSHFYSLHLRWRNVRVHLYCDANIVKMIHNILRTIDLDYDEYNRVASQIPKIPILPKFIYEHVISTPNSFSIQKYGKQSCTHFKPIQDPVVVIQYLVLQRQPTPIHDQTLPGYLLS